MDAALVEDYLRDGARLGPPPDAAHSGSAGGSVCGDVVRISLLIDGGVVRATSFGAEGCATARAAAAAAAELAEGSTVLEAASLGPDDVAGALGGLGAPGRHAADLAADALHRALSGAASSGVALAGAPTGERTLVAMSGGVDSAVAALLESERGVDVVAVTLKLWEDAANDGERSCCSPEAVLGARAVSHSLGIPHLTLDLRAAFRAGVVDPFVEGYARGATPNPCIACNGELRIDAMVALAGRLCASRLATGHYARLRDDGAGPLLTAPADHAKDQTYMLAAVAPRTLASLCFPLAGLRKPEVRELAARAGLPVASKAESQDLCFLAGEGKRGFLQRHGGLADRPGDLVDAAGARLGRHGGHHNFTVGQRRGLRLGGPRPHYVLATDADSNTVTVGSREELARTAVELRAASLHRPSSRVDRVKLRYRSAPIPCRAEPVGPGRHEALRLELAEPAFGVAPGQSACLMDGDLVVGQATIAA